MKQKLLLGIGVAAMALTSCSEDWGGKDNENGAGYIVPRVDVDTKTISSRSEETRAELSSLTVNDLTLTLTKSDGTVSWEGKYNEFPTDKAFGVGSYTLEARYGDAEDQGFDKPALYGSQTLTVRDGDTTEIGFTASPSNSQVTVSYTEAFESYMADWSASVNGIAYAKGVTAPVYVTPGDVTVRINITKPNGVTAQFTMDKVVAKPRYCYNITVDVNNGEVGDGTLVVTFDEYLETEEVEIDLSDKVLNSPAPVITSDGFENNVAVKVISGLSDPSDIAMSMIAMAGIKNVDMKTSSEYLKSQGWPETMNLLEADGSLQSTLTNLGLNALGVWKTTGEMAYLDFTNVPEHINYLPNGNNTTSFEVTVKDKLMRESDPLILTYEVESVRLELSSTGEYYSPGNPLSLNLAFNGELQHLNAGKVTFQYYDTTGMWRNVSMNGEAIGEEGEYKVSVIIPSSYNNEVKLRAVCGGVTSNVLTIGMAPFEVLVNSNNVFATYAYVQTVSTSDDYLVDGKTPEFYIKGGNYGDFTHIGNTPEDGYYKLSGLNGGTKYEVKVSYEGMYSKVVSFTTEIAAGVPNGDFEETDEVYSGIMNQGGQYMVIIGPFQNTARYSYAEATSWTTNNSQTMNGTEKNTWFCVPSAYSTDSYYFGKGQSTSTEILSPSFDKSGRNGKGMVIRNIAWDPSGTPPANDRSSKLPPESNYYNHSNATCNNKLIGTIRLASSTYSNSEEGGYEFTSRPKSLKGYYQFTPVSGQDDSGKVIVIVYSNNSVIASGETSLPSVSNFTEFNVDLNYNLNTAKATKVCVIVKSSSLPKETDVEVVAHNSRYESFYDGAILVVDDFEFVY